ncbi:heme oxygenase-like protein [Suillus subalutaceus]|uniref:heme oxygenase-like protein n=1 Tax=Suillus subalutaceus TaxID=48586 RepID=UPI001B85DA1C|nr:heme oxygenase-like protein [Suillus subalutaceus]KAG1862066.1 heme oxygenase-like protein [Suillus subalutaceus]
MHHITHHLKDQCNLSAATQHEFLTAAGTLSLSPARLALWLCQDRIYTAHAYPRFIGLLISKIPFDGPAVEEELNRETLALLTAGLEGMIRGVAFLEGVAKEWGLDINGRIERKATRDYTAEMARVASVGSLEEGLVFLWAMAQVFLDAWKHVKSLFPPQSDSEDNTANAIRQLTNNWTTPEFEESVQKIEALANRHFARHHHGHSHSAVRAMESICARVVELEKIFWPEDREETRLSSGAF